MHEADAAATLDRISPLADKLSASVAQARLISVVVSTFTVLAIVPAAIGLFAVASYNVEQRRSEIAVRVALGASRHAVITTVMRDGLVTTTIGLGLGALIAAALSHSLQSVLFGVTPLDLVAFATGPLMLFVVASAACAIPAVRAARIDRMHALKAE